MHPATIQISPTDTIRASHILLSYPLSVIGLLTLFNTSTYKAGLKTLVSNEDSKVLLLWGDADQFTGRGKYESWASEMTKDGGGKVKAVKVHGADHFWRGALGRRMVRAIEEWI
jgi:alpha/beta superfamily hydrolase